MHFTSFIVHKIKFIYGSTQNAILWNLLKQFENVLQSVQRIVGTTLSIQMLKISRMHITKKKFPSVERQFLLGDGLKIHVRVYTCKYKSKYVLIHANWTEPTDICRRRSLQSNFRNLQSRKALSSFRDLNSSISKPFSSLFICF